MDLDFTEEQEMLRTMARDFLEKECPKTPTVRELEEDVKGYSPEMWKKMADLGWLGLVLPEKYGGTEMDFLSLIILVEEMGRNILPAPYFSTVLLCGMAILEAGTDGQKQEYLSKISNGDIIMSWVQTEPSNTWGADGIKVKAVADKDEYVINGTKLFILDAHVADCMIVVARTKDGGKPEDGITLFLVDAKSPGIGVTTAEPWRTMGMDKPAEVTFKDVRVPKGNILGGLDKGWEVVSKTLQKAALLKCAESVGAMDYVLEITNAYAKERIAYGRPIGSFQGIQWYLADMLTALNTSKELVYRTAWAFDTGQPEAGELIATSKAWVSEQYKWVSERGVQIHGGIGTTRDHDVALYYRRAKVADMTFGDADFHKENVARAIGF